MAHRILITKPDTTTLYLQVENAKVKKTLNKEDYVQFNSTSESFIDVPIGSTIDIKNANATLGYETYKLNKRGKQTKINSTQFKYLFKFENPIFDLKKSTFRVNSSTDTALLATAEGFIDQIILSAAADGYTFTKGSIDTTELKNLEFTGENCLAVLNRICDEFDLEYRCLSNVISLEYRISTARPGVTLSQGFDNGIIDISEDETSIKDLVTRLYYEGSTKNLPSTYGFKRLQGTTPYVSNNETTFGVFTKVKYYDEIFPEFTGTVGATTYNDDGTLTFIDTSIGFNINDQLIPNVKALVNMTSGSASGYAFEILRYDDDNQEITLIPYHSEQGVIIPESGGIEISSSDTYKLTDLILPQSYIDAAIVRLDAAAAADVSDSSELPTIFTLKTDAKIVNDYYEAGEDVFELGDQLGITDSDLTIPSDQRIIEIEYDLFYKAGNCKFKISGTRFALPGRKEEMENYKSAKLAEKTKPYDPLNLQLSSKKPYSVYSQVFDVDDAKFRPENIRTKSVDPFMNAVDNGDTQYSLQGVNFTANAAGVNSDLGVSAGTLTHHSINALTRPEIDKIIADGGTYDPSRTWTIAADTLTAASTSTGYNIYLKVPTEATETAATVELSETHIWPKEDFTEVEEYVYYKVGYLNPVDGDYRSVNLLFGGNDIGDGVSETDDTNGFPPSERTGTTISFVDGTRTFTIAPTGSDFYYYDAGIKYTKTTAQSIVITDVSGLHVFYFEGDTLTTIANPSDSQIDSAIRNTALVAYVYWDAVAGQSNYIGDERHGTSMSPSEHAYLHFIFGARFLSGGALNTMQVDGSTSDNASAQFGVDSCMIADEDITTRTSLVLSTDGLPIFYKLGTEADFIWKRVEQAGYPLYVTGSVSGLPYYNQLTGGNWQLTETNSTDYTLVHVIVTNDNFKIPFVVMGEFEYASKGEARAGALVEKNSLTLNGLPTAEFIFIASVIYAHKSSYSNAVKSIVISTDLGDDYIDWRYSQEGSSGGTGGVTSSWIGLTDTPSNYATNQFKLNKVNTLETALEFTQMTEDTSGNVVIVGSVDAQSYKLNSSDLYVSHLATLATGIAYSNGTTVAWTDLATLETDPVWTAEKVNYYTSIQVDSLLGGYVTAAIPFGTDNTILKSDGTGRGAQTSIMTDDGSTVSVGGGLRATGKLISDSQIYIKASNDGNNTVTGVDNFYMTNNAGNKAWSTQIGENYEYRLFNYNSGWIERFTVSDDGYVGFNQPDPEHLIHQKAFDNSSSTRSYMLTDSNNREIVEHINSGRINVLNHEGGGAVVCLYNSGDMGTEGSIGHYAFRSKSDLGNYNTNAYILSSIISNSDSGTSSDLVFKIMDNQDLTGGGGQPETVLRFSPSGLVLPNYPLSGVTELTATLGLFEGVEIDNENLDLTSKNVGLLLSGDVSGENNYTGALGFKSVGGNELAKSAISGKQFSSDQDKMGLAFFVHSSSSGSDPLIEAMTIDNNAIVSILNKATAGADGTQGSSDYLRASQFNNSTLDLDLNSLSIDGTDISDTYVKGDGTQATTVDLNAQDLTNVGDLTAGNIKTQNGLGNGSLTANSWLTQTEQANITRTYFCGSDAATYAAWEIYRSTSTTPSRVFTFNSNGNITATGKATAGQPATAANDLMRKGEVEALPVSTFTNDAGYLTSASISGLVPYTGATANVDLGAFNLTATSLIKSGGTSSQFLKADGSIDSSTYLTTETDPVVGAINGLVKSDGAGNISAAVSGTDYFPAISGVSGDVLYHNGTSWTALNKGTDDQVLTLASGLPSWAAAASGSLWTADTYGINYQAGNVGIGVASVDSSRLYVYTTVSGDDGLCVVSVNGVGACVVSTNDIALEVFSASDLAIDATSDYDCISAVADAGTAIYAAKFTGTEPVVILNNNTTAADFIQMVDSDLNELASIDSSGNADFNSILINGTTAIDSSGYIKPVTSTDASAPNSSVYYSSDQSKLVFKDSGGTVNNLY